MKGGKKLWLSHIFALASISPTRKLDLGQDLVLGLDPHTGNVCGSCSVHKMAATTCSVVSSPNWETLNEQ